MKQKLFLGPLTIMVVVLGIWWYRNLLPTPKQASPMPISTPGRVTIKGVMVCLPHKNTEGPQTLECAFGLMDRGGKYYGLKDTDPEYKNISKLPMNQEVELSGNFIPKEDERYQSIGVLEVDSVESP